MYRLTVWRYDGTWVQWQVDWAEAQRILRLLRKHIRRNRAELADMNGNVLLAA